MKERNAYVSPYEDDGGEEGAEDTDGREYQRHQRPRTRPGYDLGGELDAARHRGIRRVPGSALLACVVVHVGVLAAGDAAPAAGFLEIVEFPFFNDVSSIERRARTSNQQLTARLEAIMNSEVGGRQLLPIIIINN